MYSNPPMDYPYHTPSYHPWSIPPTHATNPSFTTPTTPSFPSFPWELFTPCYIHGSSSPSLYPNHGYSPHPPNPNPYSSYSSSPYSYDYNNYHQQLQPTNTSPIISHQYQTYSRNRRDIDKNLQISHPSFKKRSKTTSQKPIRPTTPLSTYRKLPVLPFNHKTKSSNLSRRSFTGNPFSKPSSLKANPISNFSHTPASSPIDFPRKSFAYEQGNMKDHVLRPGKIRSPSPAAASKLFNNFMCPTTSASFKVVESPRRQILTERNETALSSEHKIHVRKNSNTPQSGIGCTWGSSASGSFNLNAKQKPNLGGPSIRSGVGVAASGSGTGIGSGIGLNNKDPFSSLGGFGSKQSSSLNSAAKPQKIDSEDDGFGDFQNASKPSSNAFPSSGGGGSAAAASSEIDDWGTEFGGGNHDVGGTTTELEWLPPPPAGISGSTAKGKRMDNYKQGQFADAIKWLSWALILLEKAGDGAGTVEVLSCRASCYKEVGECKKAVADCTQVIGNNNKNVVVLVQRALLYESMEKYKLGDRYESVAYRSDSQSSVGFPKNESSGSWHQEAVSVSLEATFTSDGHSCSARDVTSVGDPTVSFEQANFPTDPSVHPHEVPTSYSSVASKEAADHVQQSYAMFPFPSFSKTNVKSHEATQITCSRPWSDSLILKRFKRTRYQSLSTYSCDLFCGVLKILACLETLKQTGYYRYISNIGTNGKPSAQVVLLKGLDKDEFVWFTNYGKEGFAASSYASGFGAIYLSVGGMLLYVLSFALGVGPVPCLLMSEILPGKIRTEAMPICLVVHWVINFFVGIFFLRLLEQMGAPLLYGIFGAFCLLAVGCKSEICTWSASYPGNTTSARSSTISYVGSVGSLSRGSGIQYILVDFLRSQNGEHVSGLTWSPNGRYLASASYESFSFIVWYVAQGVGSPLRRGLGGISMLKWSPTGDYFFASKFDRTFYLWKTITGTSEQWSSTSSGFVKCTTLDPHGRMVLLAFYKFSVMIVQFKQWDPGVILEP